MHLRGATAIVTGAAQGLGKAFSEALLSRGALVCLSDVQSKKGREVEKEFQSKYGKEKALFVECDVRSEANLSDLFKKAVSMFGHIDLVVNNAGIADETKTQTMVEINLLGVIRGTDLAIDHMRRDKGGRGGTIINVSSTAGFLPAYIVPRYVATKYGVLGFTAALASSPHSKEMGVQFACLCPAFTRTAIIEFDATKGIDPKESKAFLKKVGVQEVEDVVKGFMQLVDTENCNGDILSITAIDGIQYYKKNGKSVLKPRL